VLEAPQLGSRTGGSLRIQKVAPLMAIDIAEDAKQQADPRLTNPEPLIDKPLPKNLE
jgi:hypothetical protein